jgi:hypothetical protein
MGTKSADATNDPRIAFFNVFPFSLADRARRPLAMVMGPGRERKQEDPFG